MSNRHERRRAAKLMSCEMISVEDLKRMSSVCAWDGCHATTDNPDRNGWSKMLVYTGKTQIDFLKIDPQRMARDCVLCPEHAGFLDGHLLKDVGGRLRMIAGNA